MIAASKRKSLATASQVDVVTAAEQRIAHLDAEIARLESKPAVLAAKLTSTEAEAIAAEERCAALVYQRDIDGVADLDASIEAAELEADRARRLFRQTERNQRQVHATLTRLRAERRAAHQDVARAQIATRVTPRVHAYAADLDATLATLRTIWLHLRDLSIEEAQFAANADLPESETGVGYRRQRAFGRKLAWELGSLGMIPRPMSGRPYAALTFAQIAGGAAGDVPEPADGEAA